MRPSGTIRGDVQAAGILTVSVGVTVCGKLRVSCLTWLGEAPVAAQPSPPPHCSPVRVSAPALGGPVLSVLCRKAMHNTDGKELEGSFKKVGKGKCQVYLIKRPLVFPFSL